MVLYNYHCTTRLFNDIKILHLHAKLTKDTLALGNLFSTLKALRYNSYCKTEQHTNVFKKMIITHLHAFTGIWLRCHTLYFEPNKRVKERKNKGNKKRRKEGRKEGVNEWISEFYMNDTPFLEEKNIHKVLIEIAI